jgi:uncharacterized membrane protein YgdD (TMEM256/DUF423 family)
MSGEGATTSWTLRAAAVLGFLGVALGAFGAHGLEPHLVATGRLETWQKAVLYQFVHVLALLVLAVLPGLRFRRAVGLCWAAGVALFSGSLYVLCLTGATWLGAVTPLGGLAFLGGWTLLLFRTKEG